MGRLIVLIIILVIFQIVVAITMGRDASRRYPEGSSAPFFWFAGALLLTPLMIIPYAIARPSKNQSSSEETETDKDMDNLSKIEKLQELREQGAITEEEFEEKKKELL